MGYGKNGLTTDRLHVILVNAMLKHYAFCVGEFSILSRVKVCVSKVISMMLPRTVYVDLS